MCLDSASCQAPAGMVPLIQPGVCCMLLCVFNCQSMLCEWATSEAVHAAVDLWQSVPQGGS